MASPVDTSVKFAFSDMAGAPRLTGEAGSGISLLDAFLVTGFGIKTVQGATVANGICRLPFSGGASAAVRNCVILVAGASPDALNGEQRVTAVDGGWVEFATALPDGAVTGSVTFKIAPLGWEKVFTGTNKAVYRPKDPASTRFYLRVEDPTARGMRVSMYESMVDVDSGVGLSPRPTDRPAGHYWWKRDSGSPVDAALWLLVGDSRALYWCTCPRQEAGSASPYAYNTSFVGDINSYRSGDAYSACIIGNGGVDSNVALGGDGDIFSAGGAPVGRALMRRASGLGSSVQSDRYMGGTATSGLGGPLGPGPARSNNGLFMSPILLADGPAMATDGPRGELPGALACLNGGITQVLDNGPQQTAGTQAFSGRTLLSVWCMGGAAVWSGSLGVGFFDITGPWREA